MKTSFSFRCIVQRRYFTLENVQPIVDRFGCKDAPENLARQLNYAAGEFDANKDPSTLAAGKEGRTFFRETAQLAEGLKERLEALGWEMTNFEGAVNRFGPPDPTVD